ncbi:MAG: orotate phosphoribosyltransferase [Pseudomonadota bacterium]
MSTTQQQFVNMALDMGALKFGEFTLKSGRQSPYFFNAGMLARGKAAAMIARAYAEQIATHFPDLDVVFGPAYKGIPLAALTAAALAEHHGIDVPYAFDRKETKDHGEGGLIVGGPLSGKIVIVDDVMTAGTAIRYSIDMIRDAGATAAGIVILLDRQEKGLTDLSAVQEVERAMDIRVAAIATLADLVTHLEESGAENGALERILAYRQQYGIL